MLHLLSIQKNKNLIIEHNWHMMKQPKRKKLHSMRIMHIYKNKKIERMDSGFNLEIDGGIAIRMEAIQSMILK